MDESVVRASAQNLLYPRAESVVSQNEALTSINSQYYDDALASTSHSLSSLVGEDVILGSKQNGRMSMVRRFFCLFVLFDLLLISLIWVLWIMLIGSNHIMEILQEQIIHYKIQTSFFDIIMIAISRFTILLLFYGVLSINHCFVVALTTSGTCAFLISKAFIYHWDTASQPTFEVCLVVISFILAWGEAWFLDFRVIPQETYALQYLGLQSAIRQVDPLSTILNESHLRNPVLRSFMRNFPLRDDNATESFRNFYSPMESPEHSDNEDDFSVINPIEDFNLVKEGVKTLEIAWNLLNSNEWMLEKDAGDGDFVYSKKCHPYGKIFKLKTEFNIPTDKLFVELYENIEKMTEWNNTIIESKRVRVIDEHTDITFQVSASGANGAITSRDFINLRHWEKKDDCYVIACTSIPCSSIPASKYTRGENGPGCWVLEPSHDCTRTKFQWLLNTKINGWIPKVLVERSLTSVLLDYSILLKKHIDDLVDKES